jgi:hypothetical protein
MTPFRECRFELCWLVILIVIVLLTPARSSAQGFNWLDFAMDCDGSMGWCLFAEMESVER